MLVFVKVVQEGSFVGASRVLHMPKSTVSRKVADLEDRLDARLLHRTTRKLRLTDAGEAYFAHAAPAVAAAEEAERAALHLTSEPRGRLRVSAPLNFGHLSEALVGFMHNHPEVTVELTCTDRVVDVIDEGFDVALRIGALADSTLIARRLRRLQSFVVASPAFVKRHGRPRSPKALSQLPAVVFNARPDGARWRLLRDDDGNNADADGVEVHVNAQLAANDFDVLDAALVAGMGVGVLPDFRCRRLLDDGQLVRLLPRWSSPTAPLHAVYPTALHLSPTVKAFVDHLRTQWR